MDQVIKINLGHRHFHITSGGVASDTSLFGYSWFTYCDFVTTSLSRA